VSGSEKILDDGLGPTDDCFSKSQYSLKFKALTDASEMQLRD